MVSKGDVCNGGGTGVLKQYRGVVKKLLSGTKSLDEYVKAWVDKKIKSGAPEQKCFLPFLVGHRDCILDCMELFSNGIHRALVPLDNHTENIAGVELVESASSYLMLTQMDLLRFLKAEADSNSQLKGIMSRSVSQLGAVNPNIFGVTDHTKVIDSIKCMSSASLTAVPIIAASTNVADEDHSQLFNGNGRKLVGTFSATDLRGCPISQLQSWLPINVLDFTAKLSTSPLHKSSGPSLDELVTCHAESSLGEVVNKAVDQHVHRLSVVDHSGLLMGLISLTDVVRVLRVSLLLE